MSYGFVFEFSCDPLNLMNFDPSITTTPHTGVREVRDARVHLVFTADATQQQQHQ